MDIKDGAFDQGQLKLLNELLGSLDVQQSLWLAKYLDNKNTVLKESLAAKSKTDTAQDNTPIKHELVPNDPILKILYGSKTGNSRRAATETYNNAMQLGIDCELINMKDYEITDLSEEKHVLFIVSTDGEGDPPLHAEELHAHLLKNNNQQLTNLNYCVLALGDKSYRNFCQTGKDFDLSLEELGANRLFERVDCDFDYEETARQWQNSVLAIIKSRVGSDPKVAELAKGNVIDTDEKYNIKSPYKAEVLAKRNLNGKGSNKETIHIELSINDPELTYEPGDALSVICPNRKELVLEILKKVNISPDSVIKKEDGEQNIVDVLINEYEITTLTQEVLDKYDRYLFSDGLNKIMAEDNYLAYYLYGRDLLDLLTEFPCTLTTDQFLSILRKMQPRQYSISSSYNTNPNEVHLTIGAVRFERNSRLYNGKASTYIADHLNINEPLLIFINSNNSFRLPNEANVPIIMVGPGTGIAPFRSFLQERNLTEKPGKSWLFFGDQHANTDYLYQEEIQRFRDSGALTDVDVAFSRDQDNKVYVQHKMEEKSGELFQWLQDGAYFYLCGDKDKMAKDVKNTLLNIVKAEGKMDEAGAKEYIKNLRKAGKFQEDIY